jgi:broad specificity phosphatase PhoE
VTRRLILVRHGVTGWNREGRFQGQKNPPLTDEGRLEAELLAARIAGDPELRPVRIVASPLRRAMDTARAMAAAAGDVPLAPDPRLMEIGQGEWEGRTHAELAVEDADRYHAWRARAGEEQPPGAEPLDAAYERVAALLADVEAAEAWPTCVVSHGGTLRLAARYLLRLPGRRAWALDLDNASISSLVAVEDRWRLERWNDTAHLLGRTPQHVDEAEGEPLAL